MNTMRTISEMKNTIIFNEKVSKIIREYEKMQKREEKIINFEVKREGLIKNP